MCLAHQTKPSAKGRDPEFNRNSERRNRQLQRENESIILMSRSMLGVKGPIIGKMPLRGIVHLKIPFCHYLLSLLSFQTCMTFFC